MSQDLQHIPISDECLICGDELILYTTAEQRCPCDQPSDCASETHEAEWFAADGDTVQCPDCGAIGYIHCDETAWVSMDEETDHNIACSQAYEARRTSERKDVE